MNGVTYGEEKEKKYNFMFINLNSWDSFVSFVF